MYNRGQNASRPSLPGQSTSTSTTSLYQPEYQAPPSAFPVHMNLEQNATVASATGLSKTPSPLSTATSPAVVAEDAEPLEADDMGLQMRTRQPTTSATNSASAFTASVAGAENRRNQPSPLADSTQAKPTTPTEVIPEKVVLVKKSKKELAKEAKEAKERRKAEEKQKAIEASRAKAEAAREKKKREDADNAMKEAEKTAAKLKLKKEKEQAKSDKKFGNKNKLAPSTLAMPATPLKGRTKDLSAVATPISFPATPATPAEPVRLLDMASSSGQSFNMPAKPLPLSTQAILGSKEQQDRLQTASNAMQTPQRQVSTSVAAQSPAISSVKSKRSLFGTLRKKFSSSPAPASSSRAQSVDRGGQSTPLSAHSGATSLLSVPPREIVDDTPSPSAARQPSAAVPEATSAVSRDPFDMSGQAPSSTDKALIPAADAGIPNPSNTAPNVASGSPSGAVENASDPLAQSMSSSEQTEDTPPRASDASDETAMKDDLAAMTTKTREGGLNVDLHVKYIQELDTVSNFPHLSTLHTLIKPPLIHLPENR